MARLNLDLQMQRLLNRIGNRMAELKHPPLDMLSPEMSRFYYEEARTFFTPINIQNVRAFERKIGKNQIPIRIYCPAQPQPLPVLVYMHGGGWVFGTMDSSDAFCKYVANKSKCIVVSVGYRLAPEHKYPQALYDAIEGVLWTVEHISKFGGNVNNIHIGGESSGANLAASACIALQRKVMIKSQFLINPVTQYAFNTPSYLENYQFNLTLEKMKWFWQHYLGTPEEGKDPYASPLYVEDEIASNLPSAIVVTVEYDPLRSEGIAYADKLKSNGVSVNHLHYKNLIHSFINMIGEVEITKHATDDMLSHFEHQIYSKQLQVKI